MQQGKLSTELKLLLGNAYLQNRGFGDAELLVDELLKNRPDDDTVLMLKADILLQVDKPREAEVLYRRIVRETSSAELRCRAELGLVRCLLIAKNISGAETLFAQLHQLPGCEDDVRMVLAELLMAKSLYEQAAVEMEKVLKVRSCDLYLAARLADIYAANKNIGKLTELKEHFQNNTRLGTIFSYYVDAICAGLKGETAKAYELINLCQELQFMIPAQALILKGAAAQGDLKAAASAALFLLAARNDADAVRAVIEDLVPLLSKLIKDNREADAVRAAELILAISPRQPLAARLLMRNNFSKGEYWAAVKLASTILSAIPDDAEAAQLGVLALLTSRQYREGSEWCQKWLMRHPDDVFMTLMLARNQAAAGEMAAAAVSYEKALLLGKASPGVAQEAGIFFLHNDREALARKLIDMLKKDADPIRRSVSWALVGEAAKLGKNRKGAIDAFREAVKLSPKQLGLYMVLSELLFESGNLAEVIDCLRDGLKQLPEQPELCFRLGIALQLTGTAENAAAAINVFTALLQQFPEWWECMTHLSDLLASAGKAPEALKWAETANRQAPNEPAACFCYGNRLYENKNYREAVIQYRLVMEKNFMTSETRTKLAASLREYGRQCLGDSKNTDGMAVWEELLRLCPGDSEAIAAIRQLAEKQNKASNTPK